MNIMKNKILLILLCFMQLLAMAAPVKPAPGKVYLFVYATTKDKGHRGLHFAWSNDKTNWFSIGPEHSFLKSDYGAWGSEKRMLNPYMFKDASGLYHCVWSLNEKDAVFAHTTSKDLIIWRGQNYFATNDSGNAEQVTIQQNQENFVVSWLNAKDGKYYSRSTKDFKTLSATKLIENQKDNRQKIRLNGAELTGTMLEVSWETVDGLNKAMEAERFRTKQNAASPKSDSLQFVNLKPLEATVTIKAKESKKISPLLTGIFFEDINYAADGGLYAELIQNRDFEYSGHDKRYNDKNWNALTAWKGTFTLDSLQPVHQNNKHYAVVNNASLINVGYDGIAVTKGEVYNFSLFAKKLEGKGAILVELVNDKGATVASAKVNASATTWKKYELTLKPNATVAGGTIKLTVEGKAGLDVISLFPKNTFKGHKNGLRKDLAETVAGINPTFMRFPGGCVAHGDGLGNIYKWKNTIGPLESRVQQRNLWGYHQSMGLGFFEYFQFCEDINAEPVPVLAAGVPCQNSADGGTGQQFGIPMKHMDEYVQDVLDLIEYANGSVNTVWGKKRAEAGHPKPFNLKYIGIGNEDLITDVFEERYTMIVEAVRKKYPQITIIGTVGPFNEGADYREGWAIADKLKLPMVDEHYYQSPGWFINNQDFYDSYDRSRSKVYLGEYASWGSTLYNALAEALYLTALERNADVVSMASYAPLLAKEGHTQWNPDMIYFNNTEVKPTVNYYVQQLFGQNAGDKYLQNDIVLNNDDADIVKRFGVSAVTKDADGSIVVKLVNVLPTTVSTKLTLQDTNVATNAVECTVLKGNPSSKQALPATTVLKQLGGNITLEPYSMTVLKFKPISKK